MSLFVLEPNLINEIIETIIPGVAMQNGCIFVQYINEQNEKIRIDLTKDIEQLAGAKVIKDLANQ